ncbi:hypothetical protein PNOK_0459800 [Pyrrhoderma noxium]|uniref:Uncharacterized protein n=1 Tax=Pyrrhoderma noxium TaxID=2282107 RepID=A0A286UJL8_9AGAM|nr:hypothetical protein PNOK_0459800 [Pyrrhoderma noxium]
MSSSNLLSPPALSASASEERQPSEEWRAEANRRLESTAQAALNWGNQHEYQIRDLETELENALSNSRAVHNLLSEALDNIESNRQRVDRSLTTHIPSIYRSLSLCISSLAALQSRLPELQQQVRAVARAYDAGRNKAQALARELEWHRTPTHDKFLRVVLPHSGKGSVDAPPVKAGEAALVRILAELGRKGVSRGSYHAFAARFQISRFQKSIHLFIALTV